MISICFPYRVLCRMFRSLCLMLLFASQTGAQAQAPVVMPDTPAAKQLSAFLAAFNTGKRETMRAFIQDNMDGPPNDSAFINRSTDQQLKLYSQNHGFTLRKITQSTSSSIKALAQINSTGAWMELTIYVTAQAPDYTKAIPPFHIVGMGFGDVQTPVEFLSKKKLSESELRGKIDMLMKTLVAQDAFSGTVYVAKNGKPLYAKAFGLASRAPRVPNRVDTRFNLASITKMFTAVAVAQLVEQGKLSYTDTVEKVLPEYPNKDAARKVTIHHLLSHTSGLIGARALVEQGSGSPNARTIDEMVKPFASLPLTFPPGQQFDYSNAGFILLGAVIEKVSGQSYYSYVREHIFKPAGMKNTDFYELDKDPPDIATGFEDGPDGTRRNNIFALGVIGSPAGGAYSTGEDMTRFHMALIRHKLLAEKSLERLWTGVTEAADRGADYGYGAYIQNYNGTRIIWHGGGWRGITNQFDMFLELGYTVVILSNIDDEPGAIAYKLREWLNQGEIREPVVPQSAPALTVTAKVSPSAVSAGSPIILTMTVRNNGGAAHAGIIDMEIKDAANVKVNQQFTMGQRIEAGQTRIYTYSWTPAAAGRYLVDVGAFGPRWSPKYSFEPSVVSIEVN